LRSYSLTANDQELFAKGLATYRKVIAANYMAHEQIHNLLHDILLNDAKDGFIFADLACGTAPFAAGGKFAAGHDRGCPLGKRGVRVNTISPGIITTPLAKDELDGAAWRRSSARD
jgi:hypothetical protein